MKVGIWGCICVTQMLYVAQTFVLDRLMRMGSGSGEDEKALCRIMVIIENYLKGEVIRDR